MKKHNLFILGIVSVLALSSVVYGEHHVSDPELVQKPNPHWTGTSCLTCHEETPKKGEPVKFKFGGDFVKMCNSCHDTTFSRADEHVVDVPLIADNKRYKMPPADFPLPNGKLSCITCHDVKLQETANSKAKDSNPMFLRRAPFEIMLTFEWADSELDERFRQSRYGLCLYCHVQGAVMAWSPHKNQIQPNGEINEELCLFCHYEVPDRGAVDRKDWKLRGKPQTHCKSCHMGKTRQHPIRVNHYANTCPPKIYNQIKTSERTIKMIIPFDEDAQGKERLICPSCHNAHQKGVLKNETTAKGADAVNRLRLPGFSICLACHGEAVGSPGGGAPF